LTYSLSSYLLAATNYFDSSPHLKPENLPFNGTLEGVAEGLAEAHKAYGVDG
jgi:glutathione synthase